MLPETKVYQERQKVREAGHDITRTFIAEGRVALKKHWLLLTYMVLLMAGFNFMVIVLRPMCCRCTDGTAQAHGSQDLYPTMPTNQYNFNANAVTVTQVSNS
jgi:SHS family lactate transporter-like MFS transporter